MCSFKLENLPTSLTSFHSVVVSTLAFYSNDCRFESWSRHNFFNLFFPKWDKKWRNLCPSKPECQENVKLVFTHFSSNDKSSLHTRNATYLFLALDHTFCPGCFPGVSWVFPGCFLVVPWQIEFQHISSMLLGRNLYLIQDLITKHLFRYWTQLNYGRHLVKGVMSSPYTAQCSGPNS